MTSFRNTERSGINFIENIFLNSFNWIPRRILDSDVGIDMEIEIVEKQKATGQLFVLQIKTGESYFKETIDGFVTFRGDLDHYNYWLNHSLPVFVVLHNPKNKATIFHQISEKNCVKLERSFKMAIPLSNTLEVGNISKFTTRRNQSDYLSRLNRLIIQKGLIYKVRNDREIFIEIEEWCNKLGSPMHTRIYEVVDTEEHELSISDSKYINYIDELTLLFPWCEFLIDEEYYYEHDYDKFMDNYGIWDSEEKRYISAVKDFDDVRPASNLIRPLITGGGEINFYKLKFTLNQIGESFIYLDQYLNHSLQLKIKY